MGIFLCVFVVMFSIEQEEEKFRLIYKLFEQILQYLSACDEEMTD
jgi:hypothetical protein